MDKRWIHSPFPVPHHMPFAICEQTRIPRTIHWFKTSHYKKECARTRARDIGVEIALWARIHVRRPKKYSMDGDARAEPCTRKLAWFSSATCMVGLRNLHGSARRSAWFRFQRCMVGLKKALSGIATLNTQPIYVHRLRHQVRFRRK